jgi:NTE family protein
MEISLALGGGGAKGIAHIGVLDCLIKAGFKIRSIAGTSAGGLIGAVYAAGYEPGEILAVIESLNQDRLFTRRPTDGPSLLGYTGLAEMLTEVLGEISFDDLKISFACTAVDLRTSEEIYLGKGRVVDAVLATIAVPGIFPPKLRGEAELIDGSILDPVPVNLARCLSPDLPVVAVALNPERVKWHQVPQFHVLSPVPLPIPSPLMEGISRMRVARAFQIFIQSIDVTARMMTELRLEVDSPDVIIRPEVHQYGLLDAVPPRDLFRHGYLAAEGMIPQIHKTLSWSKNLRRKLHVQGLHLMKGISWKDKSPLNIQKEEPE